MCHLETLLHRGELFRGVYFRGLFSRGVLHVDEDGHVGPGGFPTAKLCRKFGADFRREVAQGAVREDRVTHDDLRR